MRSVPDVSHKERIKVFLPQTKGEYNRVRERSEGSTCFVLHLHEHRELHDDLGQKVVGHSAKTNTYLGTW